MALSPAGLALALLMPVAGILAMKFDPRKVIAVGFLLTSVSMFWMMRISSDIDFNTVVWMRVFQVVGLPLIFIPISTLAYVGMRQQDNNQVPGISNFVRNLGGAIGVSFLVSSCQFGEGDSLFDVTNKLVSPADSVGRASPDTIFMDSLCARSPTDSILMNSPPAMLLTYSSPRLKSVFSTASGPSFESSTFPAAFPFRTDSKHTH
jgi:hypothetical protein